MKSAYSDIRHIRLMLDSDRAGRGAAQRIAERLGDGYDVKGIFPAHGKDYNDEARWRSETAIRQEEPAKQR